MVELATPAPGLGDPDAEVEARVSDLAGNTTVVRRTVRRVKTPGRARPRKWPNHVQIRAIRRLTYSVMKITGRSRASRLLAHGTNPSPCWP
jgi:hypothetical protein